MPEGSVRNFDEISDRLDQIIATVRSKDTSLERSLDLFDEAIELGSRAVDMVDKFELTPRERNIIVRHMFPLVPVPPTCREAWIVCLADKWCALRETIAGRLPRKGGTNDLNEGSSDGSSKESNEKRSG